MPTSKVVHCKKEDYDIYIGRPSEWGNPFVIGKDGDRDEVVEKYTKYLYDRVEREGSTLILKLYKLHGKTLGCFCSPLKCHGHVLAEAAEMAFNMLQRP